MSEWKETELNQIGSIVSGGTPSTAIAEYWNGNILFVTPNDLSKNDSAYIEKTERKISKDGLANSSANLLPIGSIVISSRAPIGYFAIAKKELTTNQGCKSVIPKSDFDSLFLYYCFNFYIERIKRLGAGSTFAEISKSDLESVKFPHPKSKTTQRKIAHILSTADAVIEKTQAAIAKYKAIKQGMLHDLFTRGIDPATNKLRPTYEDAPELYKESKLGWIPKEWEVEEIANAIQPIMSNVDKHIKEDEINILLCNYMDVYNNRYLTKNIAFSGGSVNASELQRFSLHEQDVIITKDSETPDDIAVPTVLIGEIQNLICGYHLCILRSKDLEKLNGEFLMLQLQLQGINKQFATRANGSTRYGLTIDAIEKVKIKIPKMLDEQIEIVNRLKTIDNKLQTEQNYLHKMQQIKAGLMADLLSGKKKVNVDEEPAN